ncbi:unnamed protein product [Orchesella dallaii]|uniref:MSP domain-containing protein n=1 Tax=Orchesella dallaii TaxID=48710 RepID=A0ABP1PNK3_9HEXA
MATRELTKSRIPILSHSSSPTSPRTQPSTPAKAQTSIPSPRRRFTTTPIYKKSSKRTVTLKKVRKPTENVKHKDKSEAAVQPPVETKRKSETPEKECPITHSVVEDESPVAQTEVMPVSSMDIASIEKEITHVGKPISQKDINDALMGAIFPFECDTRSKSKTVFTIMDSPSSQLSDDDCDEECVLFEKETENIRTISDHGDVKLPNLIPFVGVGAPHFEKSIPLLKKESMSSEISYEPAPFIYHPTLEEIENMTPPPLQQSQEDLAISPLAMKKSKKEFVQEEIMHCTVPEHTIQPEAKPSLLHIQEQGNSKSCPLHNIFFHQGIGDELRTRSATTSQSFEESIAPIQNRYQPMEDLRKSEDLRSEDLSVIYTATPIKMNSTLSVEIQEPEKSTPSPSSGPTYLQLHKQKLEQMHEEIVKPKVYNLSNPSLQGVLNSFNVYPIEPTDEYEVEDEDDAETEEEILMYSREDETQTSYPTLGCNNYASLKDQFKIESKPDPNPKGDQYAGEVYTRPDPSENFEIELEEADYDFSDATETDVETEEEEEILIEHQLKPNTNIPSKKPKNIFSLEVPPANDMDNYNERENLGPGNNGDGYDVQPRKSSTLFKVNLEHREQELKEIYMRNNDPQDENVILNKNKSSTGFIPSYKPTMISKVFTRMASNGCIEILPSLSSKELKKSCTKVAAPERKKSAFIMQRNAKSGNAFCNSQTISNLTSQVCAYKVYMNKTAFNHYTVLPKQGFIHPHSEVHLDVKTRSNAWITSKLASNDEISVRVCPAYCEDESELKDYFEKLCQQRPDLINTQSIDRIVLWDAGDLVSMKNLLDSIQDDEERSFLKDQLHREYSQRVIPEVNANRLLNHVKSEMLIANTSLRCMFNELTTVRNLIHVFLFVFIFFIIFTMIIPLLNTTAVVPVPPVEEQSVYERVISFFRSLTF